MPVIALSRPTFELATHQFCGKCGRMVVITQAGMLLQRTLALVNIPLSHNVLIVQYYSLAEYCNACSVNQMPIAYSLSGSQQRVPTDSFVKRAPNSAAVN